MVAALDAVAAYAMAAYRSRDLRSSVPTSPMPSPCQLHHKSSENRAGRWHSITRHCACQSLALSPRFRPVTRPHTRISIMRNRQRVGFLGIAFLVSALSPLGAQEAREYVIGQPLTPWSEGVLDIHHISTGKGNATFVIFPDGTTLLVDAGAATTPIPYATAKPNDSRRPGEWVARYFPCIGRPDAPQSWCQRD